MDTSQQKRVLILTSEAGLGHQRAAEAIAQALQETHGDTCQVRLVNPAHEPRAPRFLQQSASNYDAIVERLPDVYRAAYGAVDNRLLATAGLELVGALLLPTFRRLLQSHEPDVVITTYPLYQAPCASAALLGPHPLPIVTVVTDLTHVHHVWFSDHADLLCVPTDQVACQAREAGLDDDKVKITGIPVDPRIFLETRPRDAIRRKLGWRPPVTTLLAVGGERVDGLAESLELINHSGLDVQLAVVAGHDEAMVSHLREMDWHVPAHVHGFVENMPTLMAASDIILCKAGGLIVSESLASGLPMILVDALPGQEEGNASYVVDSGAAERAHTPGETLETLYHWLDDNGTLWGERASRARSLGRPKACFAVADAAMALADETPGTWHDKDPSQRPALVELLDRLVALPDDARDA